MKLKSLRDTKVEPFFPPGTVQGFIDLSNPTRAVSFQLVKPTKGRKDLGYQSFPPTHTFVLEGEVTEKVGLTISVVATRPDGKYWVFGVIDNNDWKKISLAAGRPFNPQYRYASVQYESSALDVGSICLYREVYTVLKGIHRIALIKAREAAKQA